MSEEKENMTAIIGIRAPLSLSNGQKRWPRNVVKPFLTSFGVCVMQVLNKCSQICSPKGMKTIKNRSVK